MFRIPQLIVLNPNSATTSQCSDDENIIVKLNVKDVQKEEKQFTGDELPYAYNHDYYSALSSVDEMTEDNNVSSNNTTSIASKQRYTTTVASDPKKTLKVIDLLKDFEEKNKNNEWPSNTTINCYWCCNKFDTVPFGIPVTFEKEKFDVYGCFCSLS